jgi:hypothetical protein
MLKQIIKTEISGIMIMIYKSSFGYDVVYGLQHKRYKQLGAAMIEYYYNVQHTLSISVDDYDLAEYEGVIDPD